MSVYWLNYVSEACPRFGNELICQVAPLSPVKALDAGVCVHPGRPHRHYRRADVADVEASRKDDRLRRKRNQTPAHCPVVNLAGRTSSTRFVGSGLSIDYFSSALATFSSVCLTRWPDTKHTND